MTDKQTLETLRAIIKEVKKESKGKVLKESKEVTTTQSEEKILKEYVTKSVMSVIRESGE